MKILVVSAADATNLSIQNVLIEFLHRGHQVEVFFQMGDEKTLRPFKSLGVPLRPIKELTDEAIKSFDIAFCGTDAIQRLLFADIYVFSYNFIFNGWTSGGADFMFTISDDRRVRHEEDCATMAVGVPKNDTPKTAIAKKQFLYIDAGHIPFGLKGKEEVAHTLLEVCRAFPDYNLVVKPRWLLTDTNQTHPNGIHIYQVLERLTEGVLPDNLILLNEHLDEQLLIDESIAVITTSNSCWLDAALRGKGCIVIGNLDHEDKFDIRINVSLKRELNRVREAGCLVDYQQVVKYLPEGIYCKEDYLNSFVPCREGVSKYIVDVVEYIFDTFLRHGKYPKIQKYHYASYRTEIVEDKNINIDFLKYKRMKNSVIAVSRIFDSIDADIDYEEYYTLLDSTYQTFPLDADGHRNLHKQMKDKNNEIRIKERRKLMNDAINQSFLLQALYDSKQYMELLNMEKSNVLCVGAYHYYLAMMFYDEKFFKKSLMHFYEYLQEAHQKTYAQYLCENGPMMRTCFIRIATMYDGSNLAVEKYALIYDILHERKMETLIPYRERKKFYKYAEIAAKQLYEDGQFELASRCALHCMRESGTFNEERRQVGALQQENNRLLTCISYKIGRCITFLPRKVRYIVKSLKNGNLKTDFKEKGKTIFKIQNIFHEKVMAGYKIYEDFIIRYGSNAYILLTGAGTGDAYIFGRMFDAYAKRKYQSKIPVLEVYGNTSREIAKLFDIEKILICTLEEVHALYNLFMFISQDIVHIDTMHYQIFYRHTAILGYVEGLHDFNLFTEAGAYLNVNLDNELAFPKFNYNEAIMQNLFESAGLIYGKTVVLAPYAKSVKAFSMLVWESIADALLKEGFCVCTNSIGEMEPAIKGTKPIFVPYDQAVPFLEKAGAVIGLRSGFMDVVSSAKCLKISIVGKENWTRTKIAHISEVFNLRNMYRVSKQYDLIYTPDEMDELIEKIINLVSDELDQNNAVPVQCVGK